MGMTGENQVRNVVVALNYPGHAAMSNLVAGTNGDLGVFESDGTAVAAGQEFMLAQKNWKGEITTFDVINPRRINYATSHKFAPRVERVVSVDTIQAIANELYAVQIIIDGYGSLSVENEYIKEAFYKSKTGDNAENIVDGLVKSLARNFSREQPATDSTFTYTLADSSTVQLKDNLLFSFSKGFTTQTLDVDVAPDANGNATVTINGVPVTVALLAADDDGEAATKIAAAIDGVNGQSAAAVGTIVTVTSDTPSTISFDAGTTGATEVTIATVATSAGLVITTKSDWLSKYYETGKKTRLDVSFKVNVRFPGTGIVEVAEIGSLGSGTGYQARNIEYYLLGNRQDTFRGMGYPHNFTEHYDTKLDGQYHVIELGYWDEGRDDPMKSKKQITIFIEDAGTDDGGTTEYNLVNDLIGDLNTAIDGINGIVIPDVPTNATP